MNKTIYLGIGLLFITITGCEESHFYKIKEVDLKTVQPPPPPPPAPPPPPPPPTTTPPSEPVYKEPIKEIFNQREATVKEKIFFQTKDIITSDTFSQNDPNTDIIEEQFTQNTPTIDRASFEQIEIRNHSDSFTQISNTTNAVEFLWVIDNSGSMRDDQQRTGNSFPTLVDDILDMQIGFKMEIITTDNANGLSGGTLTSLQAQNDRGAFKSDFARKINVGINGNPSEKGLLMSDNFFKANPNWANQNVLLVIIYISDEDDRSTSSVKSYVDKILKLKQQTGLVKIFSIVDTTSNNSNRGRRYISASNMTSGVVENINGNFTTIFQNLATAIIKLIPSFALTLPKDSLDVNSISVSVNGATVPDNQYNYDSTTNSILFKQAFIPAQGASILVRYKNKPKVSFRLPDAIPAKFQNTIQVSVNGFSEPSSNWTYSNQEITFTGNLPPSLANIEVSYQKTPLQLIDTFKLQIPVASNKEETIQVFVNGTEVDSTLWSYNQGSIIFGANGIPQAGEMITVTYQDVDNLLESFPLSDELRSKIDGQIANSELEVRVDNNVIPQTKYSYLNGNIVFDVSAIPSVGKEIVVTHTERKEPLTTFPLSSLEGNTILATDVKINSVIISPLNWLYANNTLEFAPNNNPAPGSKIVVTYREWGELKRVFTLGDRPHPDKIEESMIITINQNLISQDKWDYKKDVNAIQFANDSIPPVGSIIEVSYVPQ